MPFHPTRVADGGFYGFPYFYIGSHVDDRVAPRPDLVAKAIIPDLLLGARVAPLQFAFYEGQQFPSSYSHSVFIAEHGSWNRRIRSGYQVVLSPSAMASQPEIQHLSSPDLCGIPPAGVSMGDWWARKWHRTVPYSFRMTAEI
jgi:hypothetical protein